jgi:putative NIF3 family GTP cyclohydrolase 1 type 2
MVTGEVGHHDAIDHADAMTIVCIGHGASERPAMARLAELLVRDLPGLGVALSRRDAEPFETR